MGGMIFLIILFSVFLSSCKQASSAKRTALKSASTTTTKTTPALPEFKDGNNFIQIGVDVFTSVVNFDVNFADSMQLRGKDVDSYIRSTGTQNIACLTSRFIDPLVSSDKKLFVLAAIPRSVYNFTTLSLEYYYNIMPADNTSNQGFCQKTGLINQLASTYPAYVLKYKIGDLCPSGTCLSSTFSGQSLELYTPNGVGISQVATRQLLFSLTNTPAGSTPVGVSCTQSSQCLTQGYDCCSLGQCVRDLALKPGVDTSSLNYTQALQDILNNPANIYLYPQYYFICSVPTNQPTNPTPTPNPVSEAAKRLQRMQDLYNCTNKINGEYGVCTTTYKNASVGVFYEAGADDRSFADTFTNFSINSATLTAIEQVIFGETVLYDYYQKSDSDLISEPFEDRYIRLEANHNDNLSAGTKVKIIEKPATAISDDLVIRYKVDASCTLINPILAKCEKYYIQGQENAGDTRDLNRQGRLTDHKTTGISASNTFKLPYYANMSRAISVEVDGVIQKQGIDWDIKTAVPYTIEFLPVTTTKVFKDQKVRIIYFSDINGSNNAMLSKLKALEEIKTICTCADLRCSLTPKKNTSNVITDYECVYPDPAPVDPPLSQKIYLSSKAVPVRFFDENGVSQASVTSTTLKQEGAAFSYTKDNLLEPNNIPNSSGDNYVGFNEIYGSLSYTNSSAKPAQEINVKKGASYDIYVDRGAFSNCIQCGNDYYSQLNKLFPLAQFGGGITPYRFQTNRTMSNGVRSDDMAFGRACLVPASMLPWSHKAESTGSAQRQGRMRAQHFLFANGYQYDWYGFDYGSVIGSFDGVKWFSIGTNRRIKAESSKMFIAINGLFGDLTLESTYEVSINDSSLNPTSNSMVTSDFDSDGAQCQRYHQCSTDNDCAASLGWEYACAPISEITTSWPKFDDNAKEIPESMREDNRLTSILNISSTGKRCVYRGRGALCTPDYTNINLNGTFNQSTTTSFHGCSANTYCQSLSTNGVANAKFNNRIVRYGKVRTDATVDNFGLGALIPGRPYAYNPSEFVRTETMKNLSSNKALALCLPGRNPEIDTFLAQNQTAPTGSDYKGDKVLALGMSYNKSTVTTQPTYLASCSIMDSTKNFYHFNTTSSNAANTALKLDSGTQAISTNALNRFNTIFINKGLTFGLYKNNTTPLATMAFTENRCLRAPGSTCFSDLDCAPSKTISDKIKTLSAADTTVTSILNAYEVKFWQEELVCSQVYPKTNSLFDPKNNRCCREVGKTISLPSADTDNKLRMTRVPGIDEDMNTQTRYSRVATVYKDVKTDAANFPELRVAVKDQCGTVDGCQNISTLTNQYKTFSAFAERTSCSGDWIRNFTTGTHKWEAARFQSFKASTFQCYNWDPADYSNYSCAGISEDDPACTIIQTSPAAAVATSIFSYLGRLELMGIPQIALESEEFYTTTKGNLSCRSLPNQKNMPYPVSPTSYAVPLNLFASGAVKEYTDGSKSLYSAADNLNFQGMKQIFKADEIVGCYPAGTTMPAGSDPALCCTGMINSKNNKCQLNDYVDVSIYTNRYVSSEAKKLNATLFDQYGYVKDPGTVAQLACEKQMCASGVMAYGVLVSKLKTPGRESLETKNYRFLEGSVASDNANGLLDLFNKGLKINTHVYCINKEVTALNTEGDLIITSCQTN